MRLGLAPALLLAVLAGQGPGPAPASWLDAPPAGAQETAPATMRFYFFSPDWRPADLNTLAERVHAALAEQGLAVAFQAFARYEDFAREVAETQPEFLMAPDWFKSVAESDLGLVLQPVATPLRNHRNTYRKALMTRSDLDSIADLARGSIAAAVYALGPGSDSAVLDAIHLEGDSAKVIPVPKDLDGLLALDFGQVDAALATAQQYELLAKSNPDAAARLQVLAFSSPIPLPAVFAAWRTSAEDRRRVATGLARLTGTDAGREVLALLGYDAFEAVRTPTQPDSSPAAVDAGVTQTAVAGTQTPAAAAQTGAAAEQMAAPKSQEAAPATQAAATAAAHAETPPRHEGQGRNRKLHDDAKAR